MHYLGRVDGVAALALSTTGLSSCYAPPPQLETPPTGPSPLAMWQPGHWSWNGAQYSWTAGHYVERPTSTANWTPGHWQQGPTGWVWVEGYWS
jgi:hypothetical protein